MSVNQFGFEQLYLSLLPSRQRQQARDVWQTVELDVGAYLHGQIIYSLIAGLLFGLGYWLLGSPYPSLLTLAGVLACLIPVVGPALLVIPVLAVGLVTSVQLSVLTTLYALVVLVVLTVWVRPRIFNRNWDHPVLTLVLLLIMAHAFGLAGIILAPLLSIMCQILWSRLVSRRTVSRAGSPGFEPYIRQTHTEHRTTKVARAARWGGPFAVQTLAVALMTRRRPSAMIQINGGVLFQVLDDQR